MATLFFYYYNRFPTKSTAYKEDQKIQTDSYKTARGKKSIQTLHEKSHSD